MLWSKLKTFGGPKKRNITYNINYRGEHKRIVWEETTQNNIVKKVGSQISNIYEYTSIHTESKGSLKK